MLDMRLSLPTVFGIVAIVGAGAFAAGRSASPAPGPVSQSSQSSPASPAVAMPPTAAENEEPLPPGHPPMNGPGAAVPPGAGAAMGAGAGTAMPAGHPGVDQAAAPGAAGADPGAGAGAAAAGSLEWKAPPRWVSAPNTSSMRIATFKIPRAAGDSDDAELSITQAGGSVEANAVRWIGQFDAESQKSAKRTTRKVGAFDVTIVEAKGTYSAGMGATGGAATDRALLGAIVATPGMPYFFKLTGPAKSVLAARAEFDALINGLTSR
jgi:hypothetical protein